MPTGFHRPSTVTEALQLHARLGPGAFFLAGGTELNQKHATARPTHLISLAELDLGGVAIADGAVVVGATTTFQQLLELDGVPPALREAATRMVNRNVRNMATVGGQLATAKSCADLVPCLMALRATVLLATSSGSGAVPAGDYVAAKPAGLIVGVEIPASDPGRSVATASFTRTANDLSVVTAAASLSRNGATVHDPILVLGGVAATAVRLTAVEQTLTGATLAARAELQALVAAAVSPIDDLRGSAAFKRMLASQLAADVLAEAWHAAEV